MATTREVEWTDDLDGKTILGDDDAKGFRFAVDGFVYEIDLTDKHADAFRKAVARYVEHGRQVGKLPTAGPYAVPTGAKSAKSTAAKSRLRMDREQTRAIRAWARKNGWAELPDKGRIAQDILDAFEKAHSAKTMAGNRTDASA